MAPTPAVVKPRAAFADANTQAHNRVAVYIGQALSGADRAAFGQCADDLDLLLKRESVHSGPPVLPTRRVLRLDLDGPCVGAFRVGFVAPLKGWQARAGLCFVASGWNHDAGGNEIGRNYPGHLVHTGREAALHMGQRNIDNGAVE